VAATPAATPCITILTVAGECGTNNAVLKLVECDREEIVTDRDETLCVRKYVAAVVEKVLEVREIDIKEFVIVWLLVVEGTSVFDVVKAVESVSVAECERECDIEADRNDQRYDCVPVDETDLDRLGSITLWDPVAVDVSDEASPLAVIVKLSGCNARKKSVPHPSQ
jgi:hypothetical protein